MPRHVLVPPVAAEPRQPGDDEPRVAFQEDFFGIEAQAFEDARAEGLDEDVRVGEDVEEDLAGGGVLQVEGDGGLAAREEVRGRADHGGGWGAVDAEDGGAVVGEEEAGEGGCFEFISIFV